MIKQGILATFLASQLGFAVAASDPVSSTSVGKFAIEAFALPVLERVDLCSTHYPELQAAFSTASTELFRRHALLLAEALESERFADLLKAEVPRDLFLLHRGQSAMRREVNTQASKERCERTLREFTGMSDRLLQETIFQFLVLTESSVNRASPSSAG